MATRAGLGRRVEPATVDAAGGVGVVAVVPLWPNESRVRATRHSAGKGDVPVVALGQRDGVRRRDRRDRRGRGRTERHTGLLGLDADGAAGLTGCPVSTGGVLRKEGGAGGPEHEATVRGGPVSVPAYGNPRPLHPTPARVTTASVRKRHRVDTDWHRVDRPARLGAMPLRESGTTHRKQEAAR